MWNCSPLATSVLLSRSSAVSSRRNLSTTLRNRQETLVFEFRRQREAEEFCRLPAVPVVLLQDLKGLSEQEANELFEKEKGHQRTRASPLQKERAKHHTRLIQSGRKVVFTLPCDRLMNLSPVLSHIVELTR